MRVLLRWMHEHRRLHGQWMTSRRCIYKICTSENILQVATYIYEVIILSGCLERRGLMTGVSDMNKEETKCHELTETIAAVLDNNHLQQLFVSTQKNNIEICIGKVGLL